MPLTLTAFDGTTGPDPFELDPDEPDPEPPEPELDPVDPEPVDPDPDEPDPEPPEPDPEGPDPADAAPAFTIPAEQADRQKNERLKSPKRSCERGSFINSPTEQASAYADRSRRQVGARSLRLLRAHDTCRRVCVVLSCRVGLTRTCACGSLAFVTISTEVRGS